MEEEKIIVCFGDSNTHGYNNKTGDALTRTRAGRWSCKAFLEKNI